MNLFELQQRANILVQKVNDYEASLTGTEIDETDTLNQHKYADLYCLRPVMKMLFGSTLEERLNRTLENDIPLRVFASSAPANNSTFNLLSYRIDKIENNFNVVDSYAKSTHTPFTFTTTQGEYIKYHIKLDLPRINDGRDLNVGYITINDQRKYLSIYNLGGLYLTVDTNLYIDGSYYNLWNTYDFKLLAMPSRADFLSGSVEFDLSFAYDGPSKFPFITISNRKVTNVSSSITAPTGVSASTTNIQKLYTVTCIEISNSYTVVSEDYSVTSADAQSVGYKSDQHEFVQNVDMMNAYNMLQLDVKQNSVTDRDTRIKQGINFSYSSNIQDALVTESQIANIFKWNTTNDATIMNNTTSVNRQVPGIVCYYLGNNYRGVYTATIPYAPLADNINSVNYSNPTYYGAYYSTDTTTSQVGLQPGAEACRIFMPGLNYTRGLLISPQQIWQPDKKVGNDNIDKGYNWQGQAIYHELVFKNRRPGSKDNNVDFIPTLDTVADNDPQGLATRFALAQQKSYYNNRPWFNELDELYGKDATKLVNYINNNSITVPEPVDVTEINTDILIQNGGPTISEDFKVSGFSDTNFFYINKEYITNDCEVVLHVTDKTYSGTPVVEHKLLDADNFLSIYRRLGYVYSFNTKVGGESVTLWNGELLDYWLKLVIKNGTCHYYQSPDGITYTESARTMSNVDIPTSNLYLGRGRSTGEYWETSIYLKDCYIKRSTDTEPIYFTKQVQTQGERFNKDLFTLTGNLTLSNDGILSNLDGTHSASLSELSYNLTEDIRNVCIYFPELYLTNTSSSKSNDPMNCTLYFNKSDGSNLCGFGIVATKSKDTSISIAGMLYSNDVSYWPSFTTINNNNSNKAYIRLKYTTPVTIDNDTIQYAYAIFQYYDYSTNTWSDISSSFRISNAYLRLTNLRNSSFGLYNTTNQGQKLDSMDFSKFKITANNDQITIFSPMYTPGETTMTDEEFYKNYKLDYNTWATALDKPL